MQVKFIQCVGDQVSAYIDDLARLRITVFKEFPYLYEGSYVYEQNYLSIYTQSKKSLVILAVHNDQVIGTSTCIPMQDESKEFQSCFIEKNIDMTKVFYFGESIILKEFRGQKIGHQFFKLREQHAQEHMPGLNYTSFCAVDRKQDHPLRPANYKPLDSFWQRMGYEKQNEMKVYYKWKDIDKEHEDSKAMTVWLKQWS